MAQAHGENLKQAMDTLKAHKLRSFLTVFGVVLGVSVIMLVAALITGFDQQVQENVSALFYQPGNAAALADAITRLLDDAALRQTLVANTKSALSALIDFDSMIDAYAEVFREAWLSGATRARNAAAVTPVSSSAEGAIGGSTGVLNP